MSERAKDPPARGTYILLAQLEVATEIAIGKLGTFSFPPGQYAYAGSALGPGGIRARLARHQRSSKRLHWHIDYLLAHCMLEASWEIESSVRLECVWAAVVSQLPGARRAVLGFGASDCRCLGHLVHLPCPPSERQMGDALRRASPEQHCIQHNVYTVSVGR